MDKETSLTSFCTHQLPTSTSTKCRLPFGVCLTLLLASLLALPAAAAPVSSGARSASSSSSSLAFEPSSDEKPEGNRWNSSIVPSVALNQSSSETASPPVETEREVGKRHVWRLFSVCSGKFVVPFQNVARAIGGDDNFIDKCNSDFYITPAQTSYDFMGRVHIQHSESSRFLCFNTKKRITMRRYPHRRTEHCMFIEHINNDGYTMLESAAYPGSFLGFGTKGLFLSPRKLQSRRNCYNFLKYERIVATSEIAACGGGSSSYHGYFRHAVDHDKQRLYHKMVKKVIDNKIVATSNELLKEMPKEGRRLS